MTAAVANPFKLTYGSFVCGGTTDRLITDIHRIVDTYEAFEITLDVIIEGTSDADFAANVQEMHDEFTKRDQRVLWEVGSSTIHDLNPASGASRSGLNTFARIDKPGTPGADTDRSQRYTITMGGGKPADDGSQAGRRDVSITISYDPSRRRTISFSGVWTAITSNGSVAQYQAQIVSYCASILSALSVSDYEVVSEEIQRDRNDALATFTRVYSEIKVAQPGGSLDNVQIVAPQFSILRRVFQPGDSGGGSVRRAEEVSVAFACSIDFDQTTDIETLYTETVRPYIKQQFAAQAFVGGDWAPVSETPSYDTYSNTLSVQCGFVNIPPGASTVIESALSTRIVETPDTVLTGEWTGEFFTKHADNGIGTRRLFLTRAERHLGHRSPTLRVGTAFSVGEEFAADVQAPPGGRYVLIDNDSSVARKHIGLPGEEQIEVTDVVERMVFEFIVQPEGGGGTVEASTGRS